MEMCNLFRLSSSALNLSFPLSGDKYSLVDHNRIGEDKEGGKGMRGVVFRAQE